MSSTIIRSLCLSPQAVRQQQQLILRHPRYYHNYCLVLLLLLLLHQEMTKCVHKSLASDAWCCSLWRNNNNNKQQQQQQQILLNSNSNSNNNNNSNNNKYYSGFPLFYWKKSRTFQDPYRKIFPDLFGARECLNMKTKWHLLTIFRV